jgi:ubiquinone biosynthesis protein UbiJ
MIKKFSRLTEDPQTKALESLVNKAMDYDPSTQSGFRDLHGKVIKIKCIAPKLSLYILFEKESVQLKKQYEGFVDLKLSGTALSFGALSINIDKQVSFFDSGIDVSGDQEVLSQLQKLSKNLDIDWEAALSDIIGDIPAYAIGKSVRTSLQWKRNILKRTTKVAIEFGQEEIQIIPSPVEAADFGNSVKKIQNEVERLTVQVHKLTTKLNNSIPNKVITPGEEGVN